MQEIYRSFSGKIGTGCEWGYIVYDDGSEEYIIKEVSAYPEHDGWYSVEKEKVKDYTNFDSIVDAL